MFNKKKIDDEVDFEGNKLKIISDENIDNPCHNCFFYFTKHCPKIECNGRIFIVINKLEN